MYTSAGLCSIRNTSRNQAKVPSCFKTAAIIPMHKNIWNMSLLACHTHSYYYVMFWQMGGGHISSRFPSKFDPFQFAYWQTHSIEDAISLALYQNLAHLEKNTIIPQHLVGKLGDLSFSPSLLNPVQSALSALLLSWPDQHPRNFI